MRTWAYVALALAFGCCLGGALVLGITGARHLLREPGPGTASGTCAGASYGVTLVTAPDSAQVLAQVVVRDDDARRWQVRWHGWEDQVAVAEVETDTTDRLGQAFQQLGDLDDGSDRPVWLRPDGTRTWCKVTGRLG